MIEVQPIPTTLVREASANLAQNAGTYDLATATGGDLLVASVSLYITVAAAGLTSVAIQTDQAVPFVVLAAADGPLAALVAGKVLATTWTQAQPFALRSGQRLRFTIVGNGTNGTLKADITYLPVTAGAYLA